MGAIMCMGVATANSILVVSFAKERLLHHGDSLIAAIEAGTTRFRPVIMTALAMIIGMIPMALGLGDGGEQNAPLGRAVIGGLLCATVATLIFVPSVFALLHGRRTSPNAAAHSSAGQRTDSCVIATLCERRHNMSTIENSQPEVPQPLPDSPRPRRQSRRPLVFIGLACAALCSRHCHLFRAFTSGPSRRDSSGRSTEQAAVPTVNCCPASRQVPLPQEIVLPGNTQAFNDTPIYARTNGYLKRWYVDIGAHVKQGQLLAEIDTPEVDQQLEQARADLKNAQANEQLAQITATRWQNLLKTELRIQAGDRSGSQRSQRAPGVSRFHDRKRSPAGTIAIL